jgi:hypothetical protein
VRLSGLIRHTSQKQAPGVLSAIKSFQQEGEWNAKKMSTDWPSNCLAIVAATLTTPKEPIITSKMFSQGD